MPRTRRQAFRKTASLVTDTSALQVKAPPNGGSVWRRDHSQPGGRWRVLATCHGIGQFHDDQRLFRHGIDEPDVCERRPAISNTIFGSNLYQTNWPASRPSADTNAVTAVLMANAVTNEYVLDAGSKSQTSWIATFPTKFSYVNPGVIAPFTSTYVTKVGACETFFGVVFNREEGSPQVITSDDFSPRPGPATGPALCWEAQSIGFGTSNVFGSANHN